MGNMLFAFMSTFFSTLLFGLVQPSQAIAHKPAEASAAFQVAYAGLLEQSTPPPPPPQPKQAAASNPTGQQSYECEPCKQYHVTPVKKAPPNVHADRKQTTYVYRGRWGRRSFRGR